MPSKPSTPRPPDVRRCDHDIILVAWRTFVAPPVPGFVVSERWCRRCAQFLPPAPVD
ncbi:hypothetical protein [Iamia sp.]|uniref:hypothetical protein n=1 Tax=Iamia sp. TaxID=2722710 RepID=UPI002CE7B58E|nr:hypothetical protein [Iamia sp.]HXH56603.1 hypothetical protein [Iamia sp.]